ncbi:alpha-N-acetylglucosaminidase TIM-barrel domain-containing protein [Pseudarthrobacter sp. J47]|uniref:alpha-N-acetylglucosaminidase TIM-barrel domain-containing protein n=1 Tax=Pseudarthrobacter sp. J47 TaxID=3116482 RepID=UPI003CC53667
MPPFSFRGSRVLVPMLCLAVGAAVLVPANPAASAPATEAPPPAIAASWNVESAADAAERLLGGKRAARFQFVAEQPATAGEEHFRITGSKGRIVIGGTSPGVILRGLDTYLGQQGMNISWNGSQLGDAARLAVPERTTFVKANVGHRFALNDTDDAYTGAYRTWTDWEKEIDVLALKGINEAFVPVGAEAVYLDTFKKFGYSEEELLAWIPQAAHQPWWLLQNMCCFPSPVTRDLVEKRAELGARIADRMRSLGITPVLPGYFGTVPRGFAERNPGAVTVPQGDWVGFQRPDWLDPTRAPFPAVAEAFYESSKTRFGDSGMYKMDLLHEGGRAGSVNVADASRAVEAALQKAQPGALWAILGWQNNPLQETLAAIDKSKMLIVDGLADRYNGTDRERDWKGTPYAFGSIWNFGGHTTMGANIGIWNQRYWEWKAKSGSALNGIAVLPEASDNNPVALEFLAGLAWSDGPTDMSKWYSDWSARRYGTADPAADKVWQTLGSTAYNMPADGWSEAQDGLFAAEPSLTASTAALWSPTSMRYDASKFAQALPEMLAVPVGARASEAYRYDLMDVTRQVLSNNSRLLLPRIKAAYDAKDAALFKDLTGQWIEQMRLLDETTATNEQTMLGPWLKDITQWAGTPDQAAQMQYDARSLITIWGNREGYNSGLADYANREWAGLISTYYLPRWQAYFTELEAALAENRDPGGFDWFAVGDEWAKGSSAGLPVSPTGDISAVAKKVLDYLTAHPAPIAVTTPATTVATPEAPGQVQVTLRNPNAYTTVTGVSTAVETPAGVTARLVTAAKTSLVPGESTTATYEVSVDPAAEPPLVAEYTVRAAYTTAQGAQQATAKGRLFTKSGVEEPNKTVSFNNAQFAQRGDDYAIVGAGADLWSSTKQFGSIYRTDALTSGNQATTQVTAQDNTGPWARAGLIVRDDMANQESRGFLNLALTPEHGCVLTWDSNNDGRLDSVSENTAFVGKAHLRITRNGNVYNGECSVDGSTWEPVGSATVASAAASDVGLFMVAAGGTATGVAQFHGFGIAPATSVPTPGAGTHYLSDLPFATATGGHGPWERDMHNGETAARDGGPIVLSGTTYAKGLGTNADAEATFLLGAACARFTATVGIDDTMNRADAFPDVVFSVYADGVKLFDSGVMRGGETRSVDVDLTGATTLRLVVDKYDADNWWDRSDWADAKVVCS